MRKLDSTIDSMAEKELEEEITPETPEKYRPIKVEESNLGERMSEHKHESYISLDNIIRCRTCGQVLPFIEETIGKVVSAKQAKRVLDEIAVTGKYRAIGFSGGFIIFGKNKDDSLVEEITAEKLKERNFIIKKITKTVE